MDLIVQKCVELGVSQVIPTITNRVDIKIKGDFKKLDRLNKIALEASKQSKRTIIPTVENVMEFEDAIKSMENLDLVVVPYENATRFGIKSMVKTLDLSNVKNIGIMVGPEGGFEEEEIEILKSKGANIVTLGPRILRTETAGFTCIAILQYELGDVGGNI